MEVLLWGRGEDGQLGLGDTNDSNQPCRVDSLKDKSVSKIACGSGHTVVLSEKGEIFTWGRGDDGRLGHGDNSWKYVPRKVEGLKCCVKQLSCGSYHSAAVTVSGALFTWGGGMYGKLGHGDERGHSLPEIVEALRFKPVLQVACGSRHTVALLESRQVAAWGDKENGVTGHGSVDGHQHLPLVIDSLKGKNLKQVAACGFHSAALEDNSKIWTWGEGRFGRLGHNSESNMKVPTAIAALEGKTIKQISCGGFHSAAVTEAGDVFTWGGGEHGQLGHGDHSNRLSPCVVEGLLEHW